MALVPPAVVTVTSTVPLPGGVNATSDVPPPLTDSITPELVPKATLVALRRLLPVTVTVAPPFPDPKAGLRPVTTGRATKTYEYWSPELVGEVFPPAVTVTSTVRTELGGTVAVMEVALLTAKPVAAVPPKSTAVTPMKSDPVMVTALPPPVDPELGETELTATVETLKAACTATQAPEGVVFHEGASDPPGTFDCHSAP